MPKILITGGSGFLGGNLCQIAKQNWQVYATYNQHKIDLDDVNFLPTDLTDFAQLKCLFAEIKPAAVIHTAAQSQPNYCQTHPDESFLINVTVSHNIAGLCADYAIPCIFTSTDLVFDGLNAPYCETDYTTPINTYGEQKVLAETGMLERYPQTAICRMPLMFGQATPTASSFIQPFIKALQEGKNLSLFTDEFRTPVSGKTAARGLLLALEKQVTGILHLGGKERISRYDFGCLMAEIFGFSQKQITRCLQRDVPMAAPRPSDVSLHSEKAFSLGYQPPSLRTELLEVRNCGLGRQGRGG
ncbi:MAG: NAD(P)-dependent oxidoreductase [Oscillatoria sp. PMC 1051.18]|nr:NAD(P)-dependent oxidoreductase [Oscillatoria sp. PMC 1050.18]MEC5032147.1 NAD(P)-dependent oxidoreductase [Oscillatoria sp. PMC 1051.18]